MGLNPGYLLKSLQESDFIVKSKDGTKQQYKVEIHADKYHIKIKLQRLLLVQNSSLNSNLEASLELKRLCQQTFISCAYVIFKAPFFWPACKGTKDDGPSYLTKNGAKIFMNSQFNSFVLQFHLIFFSNISIQQISRSDMMKLSPGTAGLSIFFHWIRC